MKHLLLTLPLLFLTFISCKKKSINCGVECGSQTEELLFQTGFKNTILTNDDYSKVNLSGNDSDIDSLSAWDVFQSHEKIGKIQISYEDGNDDQRIAKIIEDPDQPGNDVLYFEIKEPHIKAGGDHKGRVQLNLYDNQCIKEIYTRVKLKLHPDMAHLLEYEERLTWMSLFEFWNNADWTKEKYPFRVTVNLFKDEKGPVDQLRLHVKGDHKNNCKLCNWHVDWEEENNSFAVPFGEWMDIEIYLKEGDENNGRFIMAVTPESGTKQTLFDITNNTQHLKEKCADGYTHMQPLKLYTGEKYINYMKNDNKKIAVYWDDWQFWVNKQP